MKAKYVLILFSFFPLLAFSQSSESDTCKFKAQQTITHDCLNGNDFQFSPECNCTFNTIEFKIYTRWGESVYNSKGTIGVWDASNEEIGTYLWTAKGSYSSGQQFDLTGQVHILK